MSYDASRYLRFIKNINDPKNKFLRTKLVVRLSFALVIMVGVLVYLFLQDSFWTRFWTIIMIWALAFVSRFWVGVVFRNPLLATIVMFVILLGGLAFFSYRYFNILGLGS